jgi:hypothetical protein
LAELYFKTVNLFWQGGGTKFMKHLGGGGTSYKSLGTSALVTLSTGEERALYIYWTGGWTGWKGGLDVMAKKKT